MRLLLSFLAVALPSLVLYPSLVDASERARRQLIESRYAPEVMNQRPGSAHQAAEGPDRDQSHRRARRPGAGQRSAAVGPAADRCRVPGVVANQPGHRAIDVERGAAQRRRRDGEPLCDEPARLHAAAAVERDSRANGRPSKRCRRSSPKNGGCCTPARRCACPDGRTGRVGGRALDARLRQPVVHLRAESVRRVDALRRSRARSRARAPMSSSTSTAGAGACSTARSRTRRRLPKRPSAAPTDRATPFWTTMTRGSNSLDAFVLNDRGAIYVLTTGRLNGFGHLVAEAELLALAFAVFVVAAVLGTLFNLLVGRAPASGRALLAEVRASFYRKLFLAFVAAAIIPVLALALVSRAYMANLMLADIESEATRLATVASRVFQDLRRVCRPVGGGDDDLIVWLSRVVAQDVNIFDGAEPARVERAQPVCVGPAAEPNTGRGVSRDLPRWPAVVRRPRARRRSRIPDRRHAGAARRPRGGADHSARVARAGNAGADRRARSPRAAGGGAVHHARRRHRLLHGRAHRRSGQPLDARDAAHCARRSRRARAGDLVRRIAPAGRCVQPDGRRSAAPARRARAHQPPGGVGRHGAPGRARHQEPADADPAECRASAARAPRSGPAARRRGRRMRGEHPRPGAPAAADLVGVLELRHVARAAAGRNAASRELVDEVVEPYRVGLAGRVDDRDRTSRRRCRRSGSIAC